MRNDRAVMEFGGRLALYFCWLALIALALYRVPANQQAFSYNTLVLVISDLPVVALSGLLGLALGLRFKSPQFSLWKVNASPQITPRPEVCCKAGRGQWPKVYLGVLLLTLGLPFLLTGQTSWVNWLTIFAAGYVLQGFQSWDISSGTEVVKVFTFWGLQWQKSFPIPRLATDFWPDPPELAKVPFRRASSPQAFGPRSDEVPYQKRLAKARILGGWLYLTFTLGFFGAALLFKELPRGGGEWYEWAFLVIGVAFLFFVVTVPYLYLGRRLIFALLAPGVNNGTLASPQLIRAENLALPNLPGPLLELPSLLEMLGKVFHGLAYLFLAWLPLSFAYLLLQVVFFVLFSSSLWLAKIAHVHPILTCAPWPLFLLLCLRDLLTRDRRWYELDASDLSIVEHRLHGEYQFSNPVGDSPVVAVGISDQGDRKWAPLVYQASARSLRLSEQGHTRATAWQLACEISRRLLVPLVQPEDQDQLSDWPKLKTEPEASGALPPVD